MPRIKVISVWLIGLVLSLAGCGKANDFAGETFEGRDEFEQQSRIDLRNTILWGPGLEPQNVVLPARYFFIQAADSEGQNLTSSPGKNTFAVEINGRGQFCRVWHQVMDRHDGSFIVRYKTFRTCTDFTIRVSHNGVDVPQSPVLIMDMVVADDCYCPMPDIDTFLDRYGCYSSTERDDGYMQIHRDLQKFDRIDDFDAVLGKAIEAFNNPGAYSFCNYAVKANQIYRHCYGKCVGFNMFMDAILLSLARKIYRNCYGKYVGFNMFMDAILLSLARKVHLPDMELLVNLGDWPLIDLALKRPLLPMFSWCGSDSTEDIVMPTYDITESSLETMGRVTLDMLSVQTNSPVSWRNKIALGFWRGRDSRRERLQLVNISRAFPHLMNASLTNFFFFRDEMEWYGPKVEHISFFDFFQRTVANLFCNTTNAFGTVKERLNATIALFEAAKKQTSLILAH